MGEDDIKGEVVLPKPVSFKKKKKAMSSSESTVSANLRLESS